MIQTLIVEDDPMVAELNRQFLERVGDFELIDSVSNVKEAIGIIEQQPIDLVLLDTYMPEESGFELLHYVRQKKINIDIIFITAARDVESVKRAIQYGAVDYLIKPFTFERFSEALTAYREKIVFMKGRRMLKQEELDNLFFAQEKSIEAKELPKGLTKSTMQLVWDGILSMEEKVFSTEDIAISVGVSRVSIRKYLQFLEEIGVLQEKIEYGYVGRPVTKFQYMEGNKGMMERYL